jgi:hypothetical protein
MVIKFPSWRFHKHHGERLVESEDAAAALGPGWFDSPVVAAAWDDAIPPAAALETPVEEPAKKTKKPGAK